MPMIRPWNIMGANSTSILINGHNRIEPIAAVNKPNSRATAVVVKPSLIGVWSSLFNNQAPVISPIGPGNA